ncbi:MAG: N-acyl homoserine lactonase family protein [Deltaproteobacteria bacterium]
MKYRIFPLPLQELSSTRSLGFFRDFSPEKRGSITYSWYIEGGEKRILVDPGVEAEDVARYSSLDVAGKKIASLEENLSRLGLTLGDIDIVIITHLHFDHFANTRKVLGAKVIVQKRELEFALNPHPFFARSFQKEPWFEDVKFVKVDGDKEIAPGIQVILTPGHTAGNQSVVIQTSKGKAVIAGFCSTFEHFYPERFAAASYKGKLTVNIPAVNLNNIEAYDSAIRIKNAGEIIIPPHDPSFRDGKPIPSD